MNNQISRDQVKNYFITQLRNDGYTEKSINDFLTTSWAEHLINYVVKVGPMPPHNFDLPPAMTSQLINDAEDCKHCGIRLSECVYHRKTVK